jgi:DNA-binding transcriptional regulator YiaG
MQIEKSDRSPLRDFCQRPYGFSWIALNLTGCRLSEQRLITGHVRRGSLYSARIRWHRVRRMFQLRELRLSIGLGQREFATLLEVPLETLRTWDSGRRPAPAPVLQRASAAVARHQRQHELLPLAELANELDVHLRTLQAAARTGRLKAEFSIRSVFGRPMRFASRAAGEQFIARHYRRFSRQEKCPTPLPTVPGDYDLRLRDLRRRRRLTQSALAQRIGTAGTAVVYQWESRKRTPSPVLWQRVLELDGFDPGGKSTQRRYSLSKRHDIRRARRSAHR